MKRPKEPRPLIYWLSIARNERLSQDFLTRGNERQHIQLDRAKKYLKWHKIQKRKEKV